MPTLAMGTLKMLGSNKARINLPILVSQKGTVFNYPKNQCDTKRGRKEVQIKD